jgi:hypothetical protein
MHPLPPSLSSDHSVTLIIKLQVKQIDNKFMKSLLRAPLIKELGKEKVLPKLSDKKEKRDRVIRIRSYNYERLSKLGTISDDFDDALTKVLDHWEKTKESGQ